MDEKESANFYASKYHTVYSKKTIPYEDMGKEKSKERIDFLRLHTQIEGKRILEIGSANGMFLNLCKECGAQTLGIEPFVNYSNYAINRFRLNIFQGTLGEYKSNRMGSDRKFDVICLFHVLEHFAEPINELSYLYNILNPDGLIYCEVPNTISLWRWFNQSPKKYFRPVHLYNFSRNSLYCFLKKSGFHISVEDKSVSRRIRVLAMKSSADNKCKKDNPYFIILFFYLWYLTYAILSILSRFQRLFRK